MNKATNSGRTSGASWRSWPTWLSLRDLPAGTAEGPYASKLAHRLTSVAVLVGMIVVLVGAGHLAAWLGGYLSQRGLRTITMKTNAALCLTLASMALILLVPAQIASARRWAARMCAVLALALGFLTFIENLSGWDFGIDQLLATEAPDGHKAINMAADLRPDVVIMDVSMPLMKGDEATRQIKSYLPQMRVIALSIYDDADKKQSMFEAGAESYILKTISAEDLIAAIRGKGTDA